MEIYVKKRRNTAGILSFKLIERQHRGTPQEVTRVLENEVIESVNSLLANGTITESKAVILVNKEKSRLKEEHKPKDPPLADINQEILKRYWKKKYSNKHLEDKDAAYNRLYRAIKALGNIPLTNATEGQIQKAVTNNIKNISTQRDAIAALRQILTFAGRSDVNLSKPRKEPTEISFISLVDFTEAVKSLPHEQKMVCWVAIATGARQGEIFNIKTYNAGYQAVHIQTQLSRKKTTKKTKNLRVRWAPVLTEGLEYVKEWLKVDEETRKTLRGKRWADIIGTATQGKVTFHDLRHSYAIALLNKGATMEQTARALGDSISVCQDYYAGYTLTLTELEGFKKIL
ncbi:MAG TPA: tyrosine-type recombinase/integrase [Allocoleopsis sp.]